MASILSTTIEVDGRTFRWSSAIGRPASVESLRIQGGVMRQEEIATFEALPNAAVAVQLRRWDDQAKIPKLDMPGVEHYRDVLLRTSVFEGA